jgi:hypothetical protein
VRGQPLFSFHGKFCLPFALPPDQTAVVERSVVNMRRALVHVWTDQRRDSPNPKLLCDARLATDGIRASHRQHPVQHHYADGSFSLLGSEAAGAQTRPDQGLAAAHCRFY